MEAEGVFAPSPVRTPVITLEGSVVGIGRLLSVVEQKLDEDRDLFVVLEVGGDKVQAVLDKAGRHQGVWLALMLDMNHEETTIFQASIINNIFIMLVELFISFASIEDREGIQVNVVADILRQISQVTLEDKPMLKTNRYEGIKFRLVLSHNFILIVVDVLSNS